MKSSASSAPVLMQTVRRESSLRHRFAIDPAEKALYEGLRHQIPILDAAITKIVRLTGGYRITSKNKSVQKQLDHFTENVPVGLTGMSLPAFTDCFLDHLLTYGSAVGELLIDRETMQVAGLANGSLAGLEVRQGRSPLEPVYIRHQGEEQLRLPFPELIVYSALNPPPGSPYGRSLLAGLPALSGILLRIYECIGQNYDRAGSIRYAVTYKPGADGTEQAFAAEHAKQIAREWSDGMAAARCGEIRDFVAVGDVDIKVIGAENQLFDTNVPVRQLLEQLVSKLSIPPFLLGLSWSSTERMSSQQTDILTSELEYFRRLLTPVIRRIARLYLEIQYGLDESVDVEWDNINLQDEVELAEARLKNAQAKELELKLLKEEANHV